MGYALIMFAVLLLMSVVVITVSSYGIAKDSQVAPLKAEDVYAEREAGKAQTDFAVVATKINGTAIYTYPDAAGLPITLNLHLTIKNNGSIVLDPRKYSILLNRSWVWINSTSNNVSTPLENSSTYSKDLIATPASKPMKSLSLIVTSENGIKIITPTAPIINESSYSLDVSKTDNCYYNLTLSWSPSFAEIWPLSHYTIYFTDDATDIIDKNYARIGLTTGPNTNFVAENAFRKPGGGNCAGGPGNSSVYVWVSATDIHGNQGPPSNTCVTTPGGGTTKCNITKP